MNSEELEQSLRAEFENYLKDVLAEMKQDVSEFQEKIESEVEKHKAQLTEAVQEFSKKFGEEKNLDSGFTESVSEHLKLARDDGAKITAAAIAEAEEMRDEAEAPADFSNIRDAINEISNEDSQSKILKALVENASQYTPRGAFFIVKNEHLVGWKLFGTQGHPNPEVVREVYFPISNHTSLSESVNSLATIESRFGTYDGDSEFLERLGFGEPSTMHAIPLVARGRGVAVLYADGGNSEEGVNIEALETLMRVAGLTVEVLASAPAPAPAVEQKEENVEEPAPEPAHHFESQPESHEQPVAEESDFETTGEFEDYTPPAVEPAEEAPAPVEEARFGEVEESQPDFQSQPWGQPAESTTEDIGVTESETSDYSESFEPVSDGVESPSFEESTPEPESEFESNVDQSFEVESPTQFDQEVPAETQDFEFKEIPAETHDFEVQETPEFESSDFETVAEAPEFETQADATGFDTSQFDVSEAASEVDEAPAEEAPAVEETPAGSFDFEGIQPDSSFEAPVEDFQADPQPEVVQEEPAEAPSTPMRSRFGDRNVDLPIDVDEGERRYHNDARRFARLLVSEIKLYNEQKVKEGRDSADLYERLREAIDRSREMYDKRVQQPVAEKFDYFNYELVNTLAEGDEAKLGGTYPGATV